MGITEADEEAVPFAADRVEALYLAHSASALRFAYLLTGSREDAEDVVQEAFLRVFSRFGSLRHEDAFGSYLRRTVMNLVQSARRRRRAARSRPRESELVAPDPSPDVAARNVVLTALARLPLRQRTAIVLRYYEDMTEPQAADVLRCSVAAVKSLVARAADSLRKDLGGIRDGH
ncbi:MAG TPA: SigE family RNA polymerase sigma factor [Actinomycetota bacterium]